MKNTLTLTEILDLATKSMQNPHFELLPGEMEFVCKVLRCSPQEIKTLDSDALCDLSTVHLGRELFDLPFEVNPHSKRGKPYNLNDEVSGQYWTGTILGVPALLAQSFGHSVWHMKA